MSIFTEFDLPASEFALEETLAAYPEAVLEIERVVASEEILTPYFWVSNISAADFESATKIDPTICNLRQLDAFEETYLYRAEWADDLNSVVEAYTKVGAVILDATGQRDIWEVQMRFDDRHQLNAFHAFCAAHDIHFELKRLYEVSQPHTGRQYGLTEKQHEALVRTWKAGFFESPAETTLAAVADELGISQQALSQRMRSGYDSLIANTLLTEPPAST